jgi:hypothetical protein
VAVYFRYGKREMCFACDAFRTVRENAYSIAKTIEALRGIERWGASDMMERAFRGFAALAASSQDDWWDVLECLPTADTDTINAQYRVRARSAHPDAGGSHAAMSRLNQARDRPWAKCGDGQLWAGSNLPRIHSGDCTGISESRVPRALSNGFNGRPLLATIGGSIEARFKYPRRSGSL